MIATKYRTLPFRIRPDSQAGFTLIETILYIGLLSLVMGSIILATIKLIESSDISQYRSLIHNEAQFAILKVNNLLSGASGAATDGTSLTIHYAGSPDVIVSLIGNKLKVGSDALNSDIAPISAPSFSVNPNNGTRPAQVTMSFTVDNPYYKELFTTTKLIR